jgi:hypothetical protein
MGSKGFVCVKKKNREERLTDKKLPCVYILIFSESDVDIFLWNQKSSAGNFVASYLQSSPYPQSVDMSFPRLSD